MANLLCTEDDLHSCPIHQMRASHLDRPDECSQHNFCL